MAKVYTVRAGAVDADGVTTRKPAWCDRVLYHSCAPGRDRAFRPLRYAAGAAAAAGGPMVSDHAPVAALFEVEVARGARRTTES